MSNNDSEWIEAAYTVLNMANKAMHVSEVEQQIKAKELVSFQPSMPLEVLLTKEAAMGRKFTKADGSMPGYFSLLPPNAQTQGSLATSLSPNISNGGQLMTQASAAEHSLSPNQKYQFKYTQLKKTCKQMIYLNAALYDEITRMEKKIEKATQERKMLLSKLMTDQNISNPKGIKSGTKNDDKKNNKDASKNKDTSTDEPLSKKMKSTIKSEQGNETESLSTSETGEPKLKVTRSPETMGSKSSKKKQGAKKAILIPPIALDSNGRPVLPLELAGGLTIYSLGEINDKPGYCRSECIYPVGYCCTREFASLISITKTCLYTCKITETLSGPKFEISPDNEPTTVFTEQTPEGCHSKLINFLKRSLEIDLQITNDSDFFGLKHPVVKNLLQCSQGAQHCLEYSWCKFEVVRSNTKVTPVKSEEDPATCVKALVKESGSTITDEEPGE